VMVRAILERCLNAEQVNEWFERVAEAQYTRRLLFSSVFELMTRALKVSGPPDRLSAFLPEASS